MKQKTYHFKQSRKKRSHKRALFVVFVLPLLAGGYLFTSGKIFSQDKPASTISPSAADPASVIHQINTALPKPTLSPQWPKKINSAVGAVGYGVLAKSDTDNTPAPMASLAKVMAAILVIEKDGISNDNPGRNITFNQNDEEFYNKYLLDGGVVTTVKAGESIPQRDALKAMLLSSSNNLADTTVIEAYGSVDEYLRIANQKAQDLGMTQTTYADVTGFSPDTKATASDLVLLADYAMKNPFFAETVSTWEATIMGDIKLTNTNVFLDYEGNNVIGIKTGLSDEAGGTYMTAAKYQTESGDTVVALAVTLGAKTHFAAQEKAMPLLETVKDGFANPPTP